MHASATRLLATHLDELHAACNRTLDAMDQAEHAAALPQPHLTLIKVAANDLRGHLEAIARVDLSDFDAARRGFAEHAANDGPFGVR